MRHPMESLGIPPGAIVSFEEGGCHPLTYATENSGLSNTHWSTEALTIPLRTLEMHIN